jgi:hypothetical protein
VESPAEPDPYALFFVFGRFDGALALSKTGHRSRGLAAGMEARSVPLSDPSVRCLVEPDTAIGRELDRQLSHEAERVRTCRDVMILRGPHVAEGTVADAVRDIVGVVQAFLEQGGIAVVDMAIRWRTADRFRSEIFDGPLSGLIGILISEQGDGRLWFHTRGMRLFGRADLSLHDVQGALQPTVIDLLQRFIGMCVQGGTIATGQKIRMNGLPDDWICLRRGDLDDPDFNNIHVEIGSPPIP